MGIFGFLGIFTQYVAIPFFVEVVGLHDTTIGVLGVIGCAINLVRTVQCANLLSPEKYFVKTAYYSVILL